MAAKLSSTDSRREIVLKMRGTRPSKVILGSAVRLVATFRGRLRGYFLEDEDLLALANLPFAREVSTTGGISRKLTPEVIRAEMAAARDAIRRDFELLAREGEFEAILETVAPDPREITGILAYGEPLEHASTSLARNMLNEITSGPSTSGVLVAGDRAVRSSGSVVALLETGCDVSAIVDTAERIARSDLQKVALIIVGQTSAETEILSQAIDRCLDPETNASRRRVGLIEPHSLAHLANSLKAGLIVAWARGTLGGERLGRFAREIECPLLLMR